MDGGPWAEGSPGRKRSDRVWLRRSRYPNSRPSRPGASASRGTRVRNGSQETTELTTAYYSTVLDAPVGEVWTTVRDFSTNGRAADTRRWWKTIVAATRLARFAGRRRRCPQPTPLVVIAQHVCHGQTHQLRVTEHRRAATPTQPQRRDDVLGQLHYGAIRTGSKSAITWPTAHCPTECCIAFAVHNSCWPVWLEPVWLTILKAVPAKNA